MGLQYLGYRVMGYGILDTISWTCDMLDGVLWVDDTLDTINWRNDTHVLHI